MNQNQHVEEGIGDVKPDALIHAYELLKAALPKEPSDPFRIVERSDLSPHLVRILEFLPEPEIAEATLLTASHLYSLGYYEKSRLLVEPLPTTHEGTLRIAQCLKREGRYQHAIDLLVSLMGLEDETMIEVAVEAPTDQDPDVLSALALSLIERGQPGDVALAEMVVECVVQLPNTTDQVKAVAFGDLALAQQSLRGALDAARANHVRALEAKRMCYSSEHPEIAVTLHNLALVEWQLAKRSLSVDGLRRGLAHAREALKIDLKHFGPNHPDVSHDHQAIGVTLSSLARITNETSELVEAIEHLTIAHNIRAKKLGPEHSQTIVTFGHLIEASFELSPSQKAIDDIKFAHDTLVAELGVEHRHVRRLQRLIEGLFQSSLDAPAAGE